MAGLNFKHGWRRTREYKCWDGIRQRCNNRHCNRRTAAQGGSNG